MTRLAAYFILSVLATSQALAKPWPRHTIDNSSRGADGVRLADVVGDGLFDIATGWEEGGMIRVYVNPGPAKAKQSWPMVNVGEVRSPEDAVFADLDGDGAMDVVSCCEGRNRTIFIHWAPARDRYLDSGAWTTAPIPCTELKQMWMFALPLQLDGRFGVDLIVGSKGEGATIGWLQAPQDPRDLDAWTFHPLYQAGWIMSLQAVDMDRDGDLDVLASDRKGATRGILWLENPGADQLADGKKWNEHRVGGRDHQVMFLTTGDLDQDKQTEVVCATSGNGFLRFEGNGRTPNPWKSYLITMPGNCGTGKGVGIGDIDLDGRQDLVFTCENASQGKSGVRWLSFQDSADDGSWLDHEISGPTGVKFDRLELIDLDADGDLDVLTCEERDNLGVIWYENPAR